MKFSMRKIKERPMRRQNWIGYWEWDNDSKSIVMNCKDGSIIDIRKTNDITFTIDNILEDDWEFCDNKMKNNKTKEKEEIEKAYETFI